MALSTPVKLMILAELGVLAYAAYESVTAQEKAWAARKKSGGLPSRGVFQDPDQSRRIRWELVPFHLEDLQGEPLGDPHAITPLDPEGPDWGYSVFDETQDKSMGYVSGFPTRRKALEDLAWRFGLPWKDLIASKIPDEEKG